jgi:hypothetical protein
LTAGDPLTACLPGSPAASELELSLLFRQRSQEALKQKARRGALILGVAAGYVKVGRDRIEKNPDQRVRDSLQLVFSKFAEFQSVRQVHIWLRDDPKADVGSSRWPPAQCARSRHAHLRADMTAR